LISSPASTRLVQFNRKYQDKLLTINRFSQRS
jgi:hypothetical protein